MAEVTGAIQDFYSQLLRYNDGTEIPMHETVIEGWWNFTSHLLHYKDGTLRYQAFELQGFI